MEYWEILKPKLPNGGLFQKESMRRLNDARVSLKHHGNLPSKSNIEGFRVNSTDFFRDNTPLIFKINFDDISLIDLVNCVEAKRDLKEASELINHGNFDDAINSIAAAFGLLIYDYEKRKLSKYGRSPFFFGDVSQLGHTWKQEDRYLSQFIIDVQVSLENIQDAIKILSLGLDYRRYVKFRLITPRIEMYHDGSYSIYQLHDKKPLNNEEIQFCYDFVIESAIVLQEFDFDVA